MDRKCLYIMNEMYTEILWKAKLQNSVIVAYCCNVPTL